MLLRLNFIHLKIYHLAGRERILKILFYAVYLKRKNQIKKDI